MYPEDWLIMNRSYVISAQSPKVKYSAAYSTMRERCLFCRRQLKNPLCALSALASLGVFASLWVANPLKGRIRVSAPLR